MFNNTHKKVSAHQMTSLTNCKRFLKRTELKCGQFILTYSVFQKAKFSLGTGTFSRISLITSDAFVFLIIY